MSHSVHWDEPELVIEALLGLLKNARQKAPPTVQQP